MEMMTAAITGSIIFAILCGVIANGKNRSVIGWVIMGAVFGIFGFIAITVIPKAEK